MTKKSNYIQELLKVQNSHQKMMHQIVADSIHEQEALVKRLREEEENIQLTFGQRLADIIAIFGGSWTFIICFFVVLTVWIFYNSTKLNSAPFDPYPYILLNLALSCIAAVQAPVILMSQNRKETRDTKRSKDDYLINLKAELENRAMDQKLDLFINEQFKELIEIQKIQIHKLNNLEDYINKKQLKAKKAKTT